jgi:hypothetical protein
MKLNNHNDNIVNVHSPFLNEEVAPLYVSYNCLL